MRAPGPQPYPRIPEGEKFADLLDERHLSPHRHRISHDKLRKIIIEAIRNANRKSSRAILEIPERISDAEMRKIFLREGKSLFDYFRKYCGDPAASAFEYQGKTYREVAVQQFRIRTLQKERMNSGWRYQFMAHDCAVASKRFATVSQLATAEADFNVTIKTVEFPKPKVCIYVSVKNRTNTMGGQDWPKAIVALETMAKNDQNRGRDPYLCVFGIAMEKGTRLMKARRSGGGFYSVNTEIWLSDFFWPFFSNRSYEEIMNAVYDALVAEGPKIESSTIGVEIPGALIESFGTCCKEAGLIDANGRFHDSRKLISFFCKGPKKKTISAAAI